MGEMLRDADSTDRHRSVVYRHIRLCKRLKGAEFLITKITPAYDALGAAQANTQQAQLDKDSASDDLAFQGQQGADLVRSIFSRAQDYDRKQPGERTLPKLFPEEAYGDYIQSTGVVSVSTLQVLVSRVTGLGQTHALAGLVAELTAQATAIQTAETALKAATLAHHSRAADEEVAQADLRKAYEENYLDARKAFGKTLAERLFPRFRRRSSTEDGEGTEPGKDGAAPNGSPTP